MTTRGGSRTAASSKMECFVIIVNGWKPLTITTKQSILDVAAGLDPPLLHFAKSTLQFLKIVRSVTLPKCIAGIMRLFATLLVRDYLQLLNFLIIVLPA